MSDVVALKTFTHLSAVLFSFPEARTDRVGVAALSIVVPNRAQVGK